MRTDGLALLAALALVAAAASAAAAEPLRVAATTTDLATLAREVGGGDVEVTAFVRGTADPHFVEAKPSYIRTLSRSDVFAYVGLDLEIGWLPPLLRNARNPRVLPGGSGAFDASRGIPLLQVMAGPVDRALGDVHPRGNPHYLLDPVNGLRVARRMRDHFSAVRPGRAEQFAARTTAFESRLVEALIGPAWTARLGAADAAAALLDARLFEAARAAGLDGPPGGWLGRMAPHRGKSVIADHDLWPYFERRFGIDVVDFLEPRPGVTPSTRHLSALADRMRADDIRVILSAVYFHPRYARKVAKRAGATIAEMANQVGARDGVDGYLEMIDWNVRAVADAF